MFGYFFGYFCGVVVGYVGDEIDYLEEGVV